LQELNFRDHQFAYTVNCRKPTRPFLISSYSPLTESNLVECICRVRSEVLIFLQGEKLS